MMEVNLIPFSSVLSEVIDNRGRTCPTTNIGIPLIATNCIKNESLFPVFENIRYITQETYNTWFRGHPKPGDIIFVNKGTPGRVCLVPDPINFCIAQDMVALRPNTELIYPKYLFAILRSRQIQAEIENMHVGTMIPHFKKGDFDKLNIPIVDRMMQEFIGDFYFDLSLKIELNLRINQTLEHLAQTLFKKWFFDNPEREGWEKSFVGNIAYNIRLGIQPKDISDETPYIGLEHMPQKSISLINWGEAKNISSNKFIFSKGNILFGKLRPYFHKVGIAPIDGVCSTDILVIEAKERVFYSYLLEIISSKEFVDTVNQASEGTKMPRTNWAYMSKYEISIPPNELLMRFNEITHPMFDEIVTNIHESRTLAELRDSLLPKLMSGQVRVKKSNK